MRRATALVATITTVAAMALVAAPATAAPAAQGTLTATYTSTDDWGSGFNGLFTLHNGTDTDINGWTVEIDMPEGWEITSAWDAVMTRNGQHYTFTNPSWDPLLAAGATKTFGIAGTPGGYPVPQNCTINGADCAGAPPGPTVPGKPGTPTVTGTTNTSISLAWTASSGDVIEYQVISNGVVVATSTTTSATVTGLTACTTNSYVVKARNAQGDSVPSEAVSATTSGCPPSVPGTPGTPTVTGTTNTSISLGWTAASGEVIEYRVYSDGTLVQTSTTTSATISGLTACTQHSYTVTAFNNAGESPHSGAVSATTSGCPTQPPSGAAAAPYLYSWGNVPDASDVMTATGIKWFTLGFILSNSTIPTCEPTWDGWRPLLDPIDVARINDIRAAGGDAIVSVGGYDGKKPGEICPTGTALAAFYQEVIDAYDFKAIDIDIEHTEYHNYTAQDRILEALRIIKQDNPGIQTIVTLPTLASGPDAYGTRMITQAKALGADVDVWSQMTFNFNSLNIVSDTISSTEGLKNLLKTTFGLSDAEAYTHIGISGMNGLSNELEETLLHHWTELRDWAKPRGLGRFTFWSVNRDRPCPGGGVSPACSGIAQNDWDFTRVTAGY
ncbi:MAG TPA: cellulose binding domain-containing protein [Actinophytocola sp.]|uniref:cellulose binding domain-containing protein n=1 Tax=Actinophytocola sp. TaxID=1872138 RepID=UPI002DBBD629|nr:cellulose binding domain-containing protein [Actinophytocola sp.]HEU5475655.1 cellulose binding domain-containing protein [Actinophytocola sp.]